MSNTTGPALGISIDSSGMRDGLRDLEKVVPAAERAEKATEEFGRSASEAGKQVQSGMSLAERELQKMNQTAARIERMLAGAMKSVGASSSMAAKGISEAEAAIRKAEREAAKLAASQRAAVKEAEALARAEREAAAAMQSQAARAQALREQYNPLLAVGRQYREQMKELQELQAAGLISDREAVVIRDQLAQSAEAQNVALGRMNGTLARSGQQMRLTSNQALNLSRQLNDAATMAAMGASPSQIVASQAGQIYGVLEEGPRGFKGSLEAIGATAMSAVRAIGPVGLGIAGVTAGVFALGAAFKKTLPDAEKTLKEQARILSEIEERYEGISTVIKAAGQESTDVLGVGATANLEDQKKLLAEQIRLLKENTDIFPEASGPGPAGYGQAVRSQFQPIRDFLLEFKKDADGDILGLRKALGSAAEASDDPRFRKAAEDFKRLSDSAADAALGVNKSEAAIDRMGAALQRTLRRSSDFSDAFRSLQEAGPAAATAVQQIEADYQAAMQSAVSVSQINAATEAYSRAMEELSRDAKQAAADAQAAFADLDLSPLQRELNAINREYDARIEASRRLKGETEELAALETSRNAEIATVTKQAAMEEEARAASVRLSLEAVTAHTDAQRIEIEAQRAYNEAIAANLGPLEATRREQEARTQATAEFAEAALRARDARMEGYQAQVDQAQFELSLIGQTAGEVARLTTEYQLLQAAKDATRESGGVTEAETQAIRDQAAAVGQLTEALAAKNLAADIAFERSQIGLSDQEASIRDRLRSAGIDVASANGQALAGQIRYNDALQESVDLAKDFTSTLFDGLKNGESALDSLIGALAGLNAKLADKGLKMLFGNLFGGGSASAPKTSSGLGGLISQAQQFFSRQPQTPQFAQPSPMGQIERFKLPDISRTANRFDGAIDDLTSNVSSSARAWRDAIAVIESRGSGDYGAIGPTHRTMGRALGRYQVMEANIPEWSEKALGRIIGAAEFLSNPRLQDAIFDNQFGGYVKRYGLENAAQAWFGGPGSIGKLGRKDVLGTSVGDYGNRFMSELSKLGNVDFTQAVSQGTIDANRRMVAGEVPGIDAWGGLRSVMPGSQVQGPQSAGPVGVSLPSNSVGGFLQSPVGHTALGGLAAFAGGMQSGSPVMGGLSGALSGFASGGPVGAIVGGISGLLGGLFGKSKQKKQAEKQAREQAEAAWKQNRPALNELTNEINRVAEGEMSERFRKIQEQLDQFKDLAAKTKSGKNEQEIRDLIANFEDYKNLYIDLFRDSLPGVVQELAAGFGLDNDFTKARDAILKFSDDFRGYLADVELAHKVPTEQLDRITSTYNQQKAQIEAQLAGGLNGVNYWGKTYQEVEAMKANPSTRALASIFYDGQSYVDPKTGEPAPPLTGAQREELEKELADLKAKRDKEVAEYEARVADLVAERDKALKAAQDAAIEGLTRMISGDIEEPTAIAKALKQSEGAAVGARLAFADLGLSVEDATARIEAAQAKRRELLAEDFTDSLTADIRAADGFGFVNDFKSLVEEMDDTLADAASLGVDPSIVTERFSAAAQDIVDGALVTSDAFDDLVEKFPELADLTLDFSRVLEEYSDRVFAAQNDTSMLAGALAEFDRNAAREIEDLAGQSASKIVAAEEALAAERLKIIIDFAKQAADRERGYADRFFEATNDNSTLAGALAEFNRRAAQERESQIDQFGAASPMLEAALAAEKVQVIEGLLVSARQDEIDEIEGTISRLESLKDEWADLRKRLKLDDNLSPLGQYDQFLEAQKQFRDLSALALAGDEDAQEKLAGISQDYLDEARAYYASSEDYYAAFNEVQNTLEQAERMAGNQLTAAQKQLELERAQLDAMTGIKDSIESLSAALAAATAARNIAEAVIPGRASTGSNAGPTTNFDAFLSQQYQEILGRAPDAAGAAFWTQARANGATYADIITGIQKSSEVKKYATGGLVMGPGTGTSDSIMARLSAGEFVMPAKMVTPQSLPVLETMRSGRMAAGNDNADMLAELRAMRAELRSLKATVAEGEMANVKATQAGVSAQVAAANSAKRAASR